MKFRARLIEPKLLGDTIFRTKKVEMIKNEKNPEFSNICDEVYLWIIKVLRDWEEEIYNKYHDEKSRNNVGVQRKF